MSIIPRSNRSVRVPVADSSQVGEARRVANAVGAAAGLGEADLGRVALVASEAATNIALHGGAGELVLRRLAPPRTGVEMLAIDRGPGIGDLAAAMRDGYSSAGTRGAGLGAISRLSSYFDIVTASGAGTIVLSQVWKNGPKAPVVELGAVCVAVAGEEACGDDWTVSPASGDRMTRLFIADGLGHGIAAQAAAVDATRVFDESGESSPTEAIERVHAALRGSRGAAVATAFMNPSSGSIEFSGLGNISGVVRSAVGTKSMVSQNGTAGHAARRLSAFTYEWPAESIVVLHSDGLSSHWHLNAFPGLAQRHPSIIAAALYRDVARGRDDTTVVVCRRASELAT